MQQLGELKRDVKKLSNLQKASFLQRYFKTGKGDYGEGDVFLGLTVPQSRAIAGKYKKLDLSSVEKLLSSKAHEERLIALFILVYKFEEGLDKEKKQIYDFYLKNIKHINNWDLVDLSAYKIIGAYLLDKNFKVLFELAKSKNIWERRIAVLSTFQFIRNKRYEESFGIAEMLLNDEHDLIHKAVGWMLREIGKRNMEEEEKFLKKHSGKMPRTMLRYAVEKFPKNLKQFYMQT